MCGFERDTQMINIKLKKLCTLDYQIEYNLESSSKLQLVSIRPTPCLFIIESNPKSDSKVLIINIERKESPP